jgi:hypothetical protein
LPPAALLLLQSPPAGRQAAHVERGCRRRFKDVA